jgi:hypothetical protein
VIKGIPTPHNHCFFLLGDRFDGVGERLQVPKTPSNTQKRDADTDLVGVDVIKIETKTPT